jgi:hypothetical protein
MVFCGTSGLFGGQRVVLLFADNILIVPDFAVFVRPAVVRPVERDFAVVFFVVFAMIISPIFQNN